MVSAVSFLLTVSCPFRGWGRRITTLRRLGRSGGLAFGRHDWLRGENLKEANSDAMRCNAVQCEENLKEADSDATRCNAGRT